MGYDSNAQTAHCLTGQLCLLRSSLAVRIINELRIGSYSPGSNF
jgi:hypothetical protein